MTQQKSTVPSLFAYEKDILEPMPSQPSSLEDDRKDTLIDWQLERKVQILVVILLVGIILVVGFLNRRVENALALLFALFLSGMIIAFFLDCCDLDWRSPKTQLIMQTPPYFAS